MAKKIFYSVLVILVLIQFIRPEKNIHAAPAAMANDISKVFPTPEPVQQILKTSCYDCHSNNTVYPWYSNFQPVAGWLNHHVNEGKEEVNFNEFATYRPARQYKKLDEIIEQVKKEEMPLSSYTIVHKDAVLTKDQANLLMDWAAAQQDSMKAKYPADSLIRKNGLDKH